MMMFFGWLAIWCLGLLVLFTDPKGISTRWASATAFVGGGGFFAAVIEETLLPFLEQHSLLNPAVEQLIMITSNYSSFICQAGLPYAFLMFAVHSADFLRTQTKRLIQYLALLMPLFMFVITPIYPDLHFNYWIMVAWVIPYFLFASIILVLLYWKEKDPILKKNRLYTNILVIIPLLFVFFLIYIMRTQNDYDAWRYNSLIVGIQSLLIIFISVKYGFLGVKLRLEKRRLDSTFRAMTSGTQIINHTIKNEVGKINLYADRIQSYALATNQPELKEDVQIVIQSSEHILDMITRIQGQLQDIVLRDEVVKPSILIEEALHNLQPYATKQHVEIITDLDDSIQLKCDPVQLREILTNLSMNSFEAMKSGGTLTLSMIVSKKHLVITVADTGIGISKENLPHVLDPFFSTKKSGQNFGLGLSYCYNIMQKHQGLLEIYSVKNEGTSVFLYFPRNRVVAG